jgi:hypothetical protein
MMPLHAQPTMGMSCRQERMLCTLFAQSKEVYGQQACMATEHQLSGVHCTHGWMQVVWHVVAYLRMNC